VIPLTIVLDGDNAWPDLYKRDDVIHATSSVQVAVLEKGMESGRPSIAFRIDLPNGSVLIAQTTARPFCMAARIVMAKYPELFDDESPAHR
jgi:hypothetical protein